jgi:hypothetical protein
MWVIASFARGETTTYLAGLGEGDLPQWVDDPERGYRFHYRDAALAVAAHVRKFWHMRARVVRALADGGAER